MRGLTASTGLEIGELSASDFLRSGIDRSA